MSEGHVDGLEYIGRGWRKRRKQRERIVESMVRVLRAGTVNFRYLFQVSDQRK